MLNSLPLSFDKSFFLVFLIILICKVASAQNNIARWEIKPAVGFNQSDFNWSIAGNTSGTSPNFLSELIWTDLRGINFGLDVKYHITEKLSIKTTNQYTNISKGMAEDTDYADDNRQNAFYYDLFDAGKGYLFGTQLQLSYQALHFGPVSVNPVAGLAYQQHKFYLLESAGNAASTGLNSTYQAKYQGFDLGIESTLKMSIFNLTAGLLGGFYSYNTKANWNLIPEFVKPVSFTQKANSFALKGYASISVPVNKRIHLALDYQINHIDTRKGVDKAYFINQPVEETQFNGANFNGHTLAFGANYSF